ncbi:MAG TPA: tyrosine-type recombinase/integrase [Ktedonosporobacter sp.]|nr:tyrosine-type recombinase/integrase [Ktedonosporobacter sp.]
MTKQQPAQSLIPITAGAEIDIYDDSLQRAGTAADRAFRPHIFADYQIKKSEATRQAQQNDLKLFSHYLAACGLQRSPEDLYSDPNAWRGMNYALLEGFRAWLYYEQPEHKNGEQHGFTVRSVKRRMSSVRMYSKLAYKSGVISLEEYDRIKLVETDSYGDGVNIDKRRQQMHITPYMVERKNAKTVVKRPQATRLKKTTTPIERSRAHDQLLVERDELLMCLLIEHGLRVSEIVNLNEESIDLEEGTMLVKRSKTYSQNTLKLMPGTYVAALHYLPLLRDYATHLLHQESEEAERGHPLFYGYEGARITRFGIYDRVRELGNLAGIQQLSPHILRNYWVQDAFRSGNSLDKIQQYGGWKSAIMPLYYAQQHRPLMEDFKVSE